MGSEMCIRDRYDTESNEEPEEDENVSAQESSQEVGGNNRELNFVFMAP